MGHGYTEVKVGFGYNDLKRGHEYSDGMWGLAIMRDGMGYSCIFGRWEMVIQRKGAT